MNKEDIAYIAGQLDADGCICIQNNSGYVVVEVNKVVETNKALNSRLKFQFEPRAYNNMRMG